MARVLSLVMAVFITAPIVASSLHVLMLTLVSWRWLFGDLTPHGATTAIAAAAFVVAFAILMGGCCCLVLYRR